MAARKKAKKKAPAKKKNPGTPAFKPTPSMRKSVLEMVGLGIGQKTIARLLLNPRTGKGVSWRTLTTYFATELGDSKIGRPSFKPDDRMREQVLDMKGYGMNQKEIATIITNPETNTGISSNTLEKHFRAELDQGTALMKFKVLGRLFTTACSADHLGATSAAIFIAKTQYGFTEKHDVTITDGTGVLVAPGAVSPEDWIAGAETKNATRSSPVDD